MNRYVFTAHARLDPHTIWNRIAEDDIQAADRVKEELQSAIERIVQMPGVGHKRADVKNPRLRFWVVYSYVIAYDPITVPIAIVRIVHGRQNMKSLFR